MPGVLPSDSSGLSRGTPTKRSRLSLKFFQKRETKRALDFAESAENEQKTSEYECSEMYVSIYFSVTHHNVQRTFKGILVDLHFYICVTVYA